MWRSPDERQGEDHHAAACLSSIIGPDARVHQRPRSRAQPRRRSCAILSPLGWNLWQRLQFRRLVRDQLSHVLLNRWPEEWLKRYSSRGYAFRDPAFARVKSNPTPFFWNELDTCVQNDPVARRVMDEGSEFGLKEGFTVSLNRSYGRLEGHSAKLCNGRPKEKTIGKSVRS